MNPFDPYTDGSPTITKGAQSSVWDNITSSYDVATKVDSTMAIEAAVQERWQRSLADYEAATGSKSGVDTSYSTINSMVAPTIDPDGTRTLPDFFAQTLAMTGAGRGSTPDQIRSNQESQVDKARQLNEAIKALNNPNIKNIDQILQDVIEERRSIIERADQVGETSGTLGSLFGGAIGGAAGFITSLPESPQNLLFLGGGGQTVAARMASDMLIGAAGQAVAQGLAINPTRAALGEPEDSLLGGVLGAALGAGVFRAALIEPFHFAFGKGAVGRELDPLGPLDDTQLRSMFEAAPENPAARGGLVALDEAQAFRSANPYGQTLAGTRRFSAETADIMAVLGGRTDTAVGRFLPAAEDFTFDNVDFHSLVVKEQAPLIFARLNEATDAISRIDEQVAAVTQRVDRPRVSDAVAKIDEDSGALVRSIEDDLARTDLTAPVRAQLEAKLVQIAESLGVGERQLADTVIGPRKELQTLRASRKAAVKEFRAARKDFDAELTRVRVEESLRAHLNRPTEAISAPLGVRPEAGRFDVVAEQGRALEVSSAQILDDAPRMAELSEGYQIGDGPVMPKGFSFLDENGKSVSAEALFKDLADDEALVEAMRVCSV